MNSVAGWKEIRPHAYNNEIACLERSQAYRRVACACMVTFSFLETRHHQILQSVKDETMCSTCSRWSFGNRCAIHERQWQWLSSLDSNAVAYACRCVVGCSCGLCVGHNCRRYCAGLRATWLRSGLDDVGQDNVTPVLERCSDRLITFYDQSVAAARCVGCL